MSIAGTTIADLVFRLTEAHGDRTAGRHQAAPGSWVDFTYTELGDQAIRAGLGLLDLGIERGDRFAIMANTRPVWSTTHLGLTATGAVNVSIYPTSSPEECAHILADSGAVGIFCEDAGQAAKIAAVRDQLPRLRWVVVLDGEAPNAMTLAELESRGARREADELRARARTVTPDDAYMLMYTSGTTGAPKGCVLSHSNYRFILEAEPELAGLTEDSVLYLFLPLAHAFALLFHLMVFDRGATLVYWGGNPANLVTELGQTRPTHLPAVPRIFEKIYAAVVGSKEPDTRLRLLEAARLGARVRRMRTAGDPVPADLQTRFDAAEADVFAKVRGVFGGRLERGVSGGAPATPEILEFFYGAGIPITEGFGMTETSTAAAMNPLEAIRFGTVGVSLRGQEASIADDGELLLRGPNIFQSYWGQPEATAETIDAEGWLHTGDLASIDEDGYISIVGRKKDIIVTAGGKNIAPAGFENLLRQHPLVSQVVMLGDRRPYPVALVTLDPDAATAWAQARGLPADLTLIASDEDLRAELQAAIDSINAKYAQPEQVKRFTVLDRDLSQEAGELTATLKVKRAVVATAFAAELEALYT